MKCVSVPDRGGERAAGGSGPPPLERRRCKQTSRVQQYINRYVDSHANSKSTHLHRPAKTEARTTEFRREVPQFHNKVLQDTIPSYVFLYV